LYNFRLIKMLSFDELTAQAHACAQPYRWVIQQARCRACGLVHERELGMMREHAPGSWIRVLDPAECTAHFRAPVEFQPCELAWCESCHSKAAQELTRVVRAAVDLFANTNELAKELERALVKFELQHNNEKFHHAAT
jgi:hypothetical protein